MVRKIAILAAWAALFSLSPLKGVPSGLEDAFLNPPQEALPRGYWLWPNGIFDYAAIKSELRQFKEMGLGGVDIFDLGVRDRLDVIPPGPGFMSPEQVDAIAFALREAERLELKMGLIVSSSWNAGGSWTPPEDAMMNLAAWSETVAGPARYEKRVPFPELPDKFEKPYGEYPLYVPRSEDGEPLFRKDVAMLAFPLSNGKAIDSADSVRVLGEEAGEDGVLRLDLPEGEWVIMRTVCANFGQRLWLPSDGSQGLIVDHFSAQAVRNHFNTIIGRLERRMGPLRGSSLERLYLASYESEAGVIWTPELPAEFEARNGYAIEPYIPALYGYTIKNREHTERFLYDFRKTVSDLFVENLYREASSVCRDHGLLLCSEAGGPGPPLHNVPTEDLKALGSVDVMRGEFWNRETRWTDGDGLNLTQVVKSIASAAHIYGHKIVEMEAFTSHIHWQEGPSTFKPLADRAFCEGMNRVVYHTMSHHPPEAGVPGWTYQAGTHMTPNLTWWPLSQQLHQYLARCSSMLMTGRYAAEVCYYYGHEIPNFAQPKHIRPGLGFGYSYDDINTEVLLTARTENGKIVLESGMRYDVLVLPDSKRMDGAAMDKIESLLRQGATVVGPRPERAYGLGGYPEEDLRVRRIADAVWGSGGNGKPIDKRYGRGRIVRGKPVREVLLDMGIAPSLQVFGAPSE